ncbi:single-stranded-DNA-specific exonuclease RecJ [Paenibacillus cellulositrophicus]|uniref:single-stranded-DNA-specific exonuclease RecJ n=1 Tax=Paenibacillus cellulositrophicus TaxID=562959 RepID=UPI00203A3F5D|nr:single-stranded-DNA-specific exonuclease RecJ [Paenibacillus cellulositrophicus]MCM2999897.1 single-stranded-DNA-specific exonuclease RecJ [Paenibacillus cellulositrophicus]
MFDSKYEWRTSETDPEKAGRLAQELSVSPLVGSLLAARGINSAEEAAMFLNGGLDALHDPFLLLGMKEAVPRIQKAVETGEHILIYGDYDADGVSSTSLMIHFMRYLGASYDIYIPHRSNEGYGLHNHALDWAHQQGVSLIITVDTGISAVEQIAYANSLGMDVIVTDHHEPPEVLPDAYALINPKQPNCPYPFKGLAGVGVAYKLTQAMLGQPPVEWTEIVAIGTIADLMPLSGENRILVSRGLEQMRSSAFPGIRALMEVGGITMRNVTSINVAFGMAPRINASGRLDHAGSAVALLTTEDEDEALRLSHGLDELNKERQQVVDDIVQEATSQLLAKTDGSRVPDVIVLAGEGWNVGVVGIVASKILERYYRPVIILGIDPDTGMCKGSARSIPGLDIYEALTSCKSLMDHYGGHPSAAGMSLHRDQLDAFEQALNEYAAGVLTESDFIPVAASDGEWRLSDVPLSVIDEMEMLSPFGMANPVPKFIFRGCRLLETRKMGRDSKHLKLVVQQDGIRLEVVAFGKGELAEVLTEGAELDLLGEMSVNEWNGSRRPQLMLQDLKLTQPQVFDLRGSKDPWQEIDRVSQLIGSHFRLGPTQVAAVLEREILDPAKIRLNESTLWVYDKNAGILAYHPNEERSGQDDVTTLFMLNAPETPEQLDAVLFSFPKLSNVFLLHQVHKRERLAVPDRDQFKKLYILLSRIAAEPVQEETALSRLSQQASCSIRMVTKMMDVFEELSFIDRQEGFIRFIPKPPKRDLASSRHFLALGNLAEMEQHLLYASTPQVTSWFISRMQGAS